ncbi:MULTISPECIES: hypothetical protein [unclassified Gordonia (in: high G+C Gram-positive bacteria)]|nr:MULTISPECIES: hypothetical protein [unclassified Gordonia (in: high G+C Gram-positive bacteria)]UQE74560.1 hypothetical protein MYK68_17870 [Gordonia sp. PP30]
MTSEILGLPPGPITRETFDALPDDGHHAILTVAAPFPVTVPLSALIL